MSDWPGRIAIMGKASDKGDRAGQRIAFAASDNRFARLGGPEIIDAQIKRSLRSELVRPQPDRHARHHIHHSKDRAGRHDASGAVADKPLVIGEFKFTPIVAVPIIVDADERIMAIFAHH